jgi:hypothetical protein
MNLIPESLQDFERTTNPMRALDIGKASMVKVIDSDDLSLMLVGYDYNKKEHSMKTFINKGSYRLDLRDLKETEELYQRSKKFWDLLKDHIQIVKMGFEFDELDRLESYVKREMKKDPRKKFAYDCNPGGNYINILFSDIELPSAQTVEELIQDI